MVRIEYLVKVDLGKEKRLVVVLYNTKSDAVIPLASSSYDTVAEILTELGFGILVEPKTISLEEFREDVNKSPILNLIDWNEMGVYARN